MLRIPRRHSHYVYGIVQAGLTCLVAAAIASVPFVATGGFFRHWFASWLVSWATMLPVVFVAAPLLKSVSLRLTRD